MEGLKNSQWYVFIESGVSIRLPKFKSFCWLCPHLLQPSSYILKRILHILNIITAYTEYYSGPQQSLLEMFFFGSYWKVKNLCDLNLLTHSQGSKIQRLNCCFGEQLQNEELSCLAPGLSDGVRLPKELRSWPQASQRKLSEEKMWRCVGCTISSFTWHIRQWI